MLAAFGVGLGFFANYTNNTLLGVFAFKFTVVGVVAGFGYVIYRFFRFGRDAKEATHEE